MVLKFVMRALLHVVPEVHSAVRVQTLMQRQNVIRTGPICAVMEEGQMVWMVLVILQTVGRLTRAIVLIVRAGIPRSMAYVSRLAPPLASRCAAVTTSMSVRREGTVILNPAIRVEVLHVPKTSSTSWIVARAIM